ncbi:PD-(D/E)XK nuclease family protein [Brachybacterium sp. GCM10030267]|uniref:PD-(D/E)XK nuclease family protein n=1 Tax=Brachybacterium sp. GCM10030267 TaxID=3273381 RepID=UPI00361C0646
MQIEFGWSLDNAAWADGSAATGTVRMGPRSLVHLLQTRLALTRPDVHPAVRIAQYSRAIAAADHPWPRASFAADPWATSATLLTWRDAAVVAGAELRGHSELPARIDALRSIEEQIRGADGSASGGPALALSPGASDDLRELVDLLESVVASGSPWPLGIEIIRCHEDPQRLPGLWGRLLMLLEAAGVALVRPAPGSGAGDAGRPELVIVEAEDEWAAAETAARYLAGRAAEPAPVGSAPSLQVLATADTVLLDQELHRRGQAALGVAEPSADRTALQILPLYLSIAIAPVDVQQLAAFLDLRVLDAPEDDRDPVGLVPRPVRRGFLDAIAQEPGTGGPAWNAVLQQLAADVQGAGPEERPRAETALATAQSLSDLVTSPLQPETLTPARLREATAWLQTRLRSLGQGDAGLLRASAHLAVFHDVLDTLPAGHVLGRRELAQILEAAGGRAASPFARPEATAAWRTCTRPSQLLPRGGDVLWWGADRHDAATGVTWDDAEVGALVELGARILDPAHVAALETEAGLRGLSGADRLIVVRTRTRAQKATAPASLLAHLAAERAGVGEDVAAVLSRHTHAPADAIGHGVWELAGARRELSMPARTRPPQLPGTLTKHAGPAPHLLPRSLSYSQAENLLGCRQKWTYRSGLGIRPASVSSVPTGNQMIGTLVHAVVEDLVDTARAAGRMGPPTGEEIGAAFDAKVPQLASELLLPGREVELTTTRENAVTSLQEFFARLVEAGLTITSVESRFEETLTLHLRSGDVDVPFTGFRDVVAEDSAGRPTVIDLKWTAAATKYPDLFETGEALQLASYAWSLHRQDAEVGYYLLKQGEFVSANPALDPHGRPTLDIDAAWSTTTTGITEALDAIRDGEVDAASGQILLDAGQDLATARTTAKKTYEKAREAARADGGIVVDARCDFCDFALLCGLRGDDS